MMRQVQVVLVCVVAIAFTAASTASAQTEFLDSSARPTTLTIAGVQNLYTVTNRPGAAHDSLAVHTLSNTGNTWQVLPMPTAPFTPTSFNPATGPAAIDPTAWRPWGPRVFVVSPSSGTNPAALWEYVYNTSTGAAVWNWLGGPPGGSLDNGPQIDVAWDGDLDSPYILLAIRTSDGGLWSAWVSFGSMGLPSGDMVAWERLTGLPAWYPGCLAGPGMLSTASPIATNFPGLQDDGSPSSGDAEIYGISTDGKLWRYRWFLDCWDQPGRPGGTTIDTVSIQPWTSSGITNVVVAGFGTYSDPVELAQTNSTGGGGIWSWSSLLAGGPSGVTYNRNNIYRARNGIPPRIWMNDSAYNIWSCDLPTGSNACAWTHTTTALPSDERTASDVFHVTWGDKTVVYGVGSIGSTAKYLYGYDSLAAQWQNHLAPQSASDERLTGATNVAEYAGDEFYGTVAVAGATQGAGSGPTAWRSVDDGNTWSPSPVTPPAGYTLRGDLSVGFDATGNEYLSGGEELVSSGHWWVGITEWPAGAGGFSAMTTIPPTLGFIDRPYLVTDRRAGMAGWMYLTWSGAGTSGRFTYCDPRRAGGCATGTGGAWCQLGTPGGFVLPSNTACSGLDAGTATGCPIAQDASGTLWVVIADDAACVNAASTGIPTGYPAYNFVGSSPVTSVFGVRSITIDPKQSCGAPVLSATPECFAYAVTGFTVDNDPSHYRGFTTTLSAAQDRSGFLALTLRAYRNVSNLGPCTTSSCRSDAFTIYRDAVHGWCGPGHCVSTPTPGHTFVTPGDMYLMNVGDGTLTADYNHLLPGSVALDYGQVGGTWITFQPPGATTPYVAQSSFFSFSASTGLLQTPVAASADWSNFVGAWYQPADWYGDLNNQVNARLHAHLVNPYVGSTNQATPTAATKSPFAP